MAFKRCQLLLCGIVFQTGAAFAAASAEAARPGAEARLEHHPLIQPETAVLAILALALVGLLILKKLARPSFNRLAGELGGPGLQPASQPDKLAEEQDFARFALEYQAGPAAAAVSAPGIASSVSTAPSAPASEKAAGDGGQLKEFFAWVPGQVASLRNLVDKCSRAEGQPAQHDLLVEVSAQITLLKHRAGLPELRPAWQLAAALEGLLKQLTGRANNINHSTLRTIAGGLELFGDLCVPGVRQDLAANPPIRILAVDDDPVMRFALSAAAKKAFDQPELAETGEAALGLARQHGYDLVILDVMMPGMDGFELCGKIRQTKPNSSTPVLFVTSLTDFDSRTKSLCLGGNDLMGKPFITFEITVKALTLVLRARFRDRDRIKGVSAGSSANGAPAVHWPELRAVPLAEEDPAPLGDLFPEPTPAKNHAGTGPVVLLPPPVFAAAATAGRNPDQAAPNAAREFSPAFLAYMEACVREMIHQIKLIGGLEDGVARREMLVRLHLRLQSLSRSINQPELRPAFELCCAVEGLIKKLKDDATKTCPSALRTATMGLELLQEVCAPGVRPDLASNPQIRILVVDDEPLARRALTGALQLSLPRPDGAESAEAALALAQDKEFDLIFLDVCMPLTDGFTVCAKIRESGPNRATPVVFVTSHSDEEFRAQSARCGGNDFVVKPFVFMEIPVKALTFVLRGRLEKLRTKPAQNKTAPA